MLKSGDLPLFDSWEIHLEHLLAEDVLENDFSVSQIKLWSVVLDVPVRYGVVPETKEQLKFPVVFVCNIHVSRYVVRQEPLESNFERVNLLLADSQS